ncbi:MAG: zinc ribbon domain-containing protein [Caldilineaceae bacterium]|nr:zinc ribbon domain-containing protein [Caldilineaceae bacterium]
MPLFEFKCTACGAVFEQLVRSTRNAQEVICPSCRSAETRKLLSGFAVAGGSSGSTSSAAANCAPGGT